MTDTYDIYYSFYDIVLPLWHIVLHLWHILMTYVSMTYVRWMMTYLHDIYRAWHMPWHIPYDIYVCHHDIYHRKTFLSWHIAWHTPMTYDMSCDMSLKFQICHRHHRSSRHTVYVMVDFSLPMQSQGYEVEVKHVPAHVGVYGNEKADRLAGAACKRAHRNCVLTPAERQERQLESMTDVLVASLLANTK